MRWLAGLTRWVGFGSGLDQSALWVVSRRSIKNKVQWDDNADLIVLIMNWMSKLIGWSRCCEVWGVMALPVLIAQTLHIMYCKILAVTAANAAYHSLAIFSHADISFYIYIQKQPKQPRKHQHPASCNAKTNTKPRPIKQL